MLPAEIGTCVVTRRFFLLKMSFEHSGRVVLFCFGFEATSISNSQKSKRFKRISWGFFISLVCKTSD